MQKHRYRRPFPRRSSRLGAGGFTLLEIMFAIMVIAVLTAIAAPGIAKTRASTQITEAEANLEILASAIRQLAWDTGEWPGGIARNVAGDQEAWNLAVGSVGLLLTDGRFSNWKGPYLARMPLDPWGSPYFFDPDYRVSGSMRVVVGSFGPNRAGRNLYDSDNIYVILD